MTFSVKKRLEELDLQPFEFEDKNGVLHQLPNLMMVDADLADELMELLVTDVSQGLLLLAGNEATVEAIKKTPAGILAELQKAWMEHSQAHLGKSGASSDSSASTVRSSKPTSRVSSTKRAPRKR